MAPTHERASPPLGSGGTCLAVLPAPSIDESELLEGSDYRQANSRHSCQIPFEAALDSIVVRIAPEA